MKDDKEFFGCYVSITHQPLTADQIAQDVAIEQGKLFRSYIWGQNGIDEQLTKLKNDDYGNDLKLALFQFYVNPIPIQIQNIKSIDGYSKKEKSISLPIIVTKENLFDKLENERQAFLKQSVKEKLRLLSDFIIVKKLDTNMEKLMSDIETVFNR